MPPLMYRTKLQQGQMLMELSVVLGLLIPPLLLVLALLGNYLQQSQQRDILTRHAAVAQLAEPSLLTLDASAELLVSDTRQP